jgi:hypothetical protein
MTVCCQILRPDRNRAEVKAFIPIKEQQVGIRVQQIIAGSFLFC